MIPALLSLAVLGAWLAAAGFARLRTPLDRLHCVTFLNVVSGGALLVATLLSDGVSDRFGKLALLVALALLTGAATAHAVGRAILQRSGEGA